VNVFARMALHRAARRYARLLPGELQADYGASGAYTAGQIAATLDRRQGPGRYVAVAYAGFLTESDCQAIAPSLPVVLPYNLARDLFQHTFLMMLAVSVPLLIRENTGRTST